MNPIDSIQVDPITGRITVSDQVPPIEETGLLRDIPYSILARMAYDATMGDGYARRLAMAAVGLLDDEQLVLALRVALDNDLGADLPALDEAILNRVDRGVLADVLVEAARGDDEGLRKAAIAQDKAGLSSVGESLVEQGVLNARRYERARARSRNARGPRK